MDGHRLVRRPRNFRGKVRGGQPVGCECGVMSVVGTVRDGIAWHVGHVQGLSATPVVEPTPMLDELRDRLAGLTERVQAVTCGN